MSLDISSLSASGGRFNLVDSSGQVQSLDLGTLILMLQLERANGLDKQLGEIINEMNGRNQKIKNLNEFIEQARKLKAEGKGDDAEVTINGVKKSAAEWAKELGVTWTPVKGTKEEIAAKWDTNLQNLKTALEMQNTDSQQTSLKMQNLLEKRNNVFEMASKVMATNNTSVQSIIRNL